MSNIQELIEQERDQARAVCGIKGDTSSECAVAWEVVEELQAEACHKRQIKRKSSFEQYCDDNPEADECRMYEE